MSSAIKPVYEDFSHQQERHTDGTTHSQATLCMWTRQRIIWVWRPELAQRVERPKDLDKAHLVGNPGARASRRRAGARRAVL